LNPTDPFLTFAQLTDIETSNGVDLTEKMQHGFKKGRSTVTALKEIQSQIKAKIYQGNFVAMGSLDLSAAFDLVNIDLLIARLTTLGLPSDWMDLIKAWLRDRSAFVEVSSGRLMLFDLDIGTEQGSILGPVLFSLFASPVFDSNNIIAYAYDTYIKTSARSKDAVIKEVGEALAAVSLWFKNSGLKVNDGKTEVAIFNKNNCNPEDVTVNGVMIRTKNTIRVLGVTMDTTLSCH
jgi:hypothetical protein